MQYDQCGQKTAEFESEENGNEDEMTFIESCYVGFTYMN